MAASRKQQSWSLGLAGLMTGIAAAVVVESSSAQPPAPSSATAPAAAASAAPASTTDAPAAVREIDEATIAEITGGRPIAAIDVNADEVTVIGSRTPRTVVTIDREIERTTMNFYDLLNEVVASKEYQVDCAWGTSEEKGFGESRIRRRYCFAGYQMEELRLVMEAREDAQAIAEGAEDAPDVAFVYEPDQAKLREKEEQFANVIIEAMLAYPALMVAGEQLTQLHTERTELTGGAPALDAHAEARQKAREAVNPELLRQRQLEEQQQPEVLRQQQPEPSGNARRRR